MKRNFAVFLMGPPAAGKSTLARAISRATGARSIQSGQILRAVSSSSDYGELGSTVRGYLATSAPVPIPVYVECLLKQQELRGSGSYVFDGFPKSMEQCAGIDLLLTALDLPVHNIAIRGILLRAEASQLSSRSRIRLMCGSCGAESTDTVTCCSSFTPVKRDDDEAEHFNRRVADYYATESEVSSCFAMKNLLITVDSSRTPFSVLHDVLDSLENA